MVFGAVSRMARFQWQVRGNFFLLGGFGLFYLKFGNDHLFFRHAYNNLLFFTEKKGVMMTEFNRHCDKYSKQAFDKSAVEKGLQTKEKIYKTALATFHEIDDDGNGVLDKNEVRAFAQEMLDQFKPGHKVDEHEFQK